MVVRDVVRGLYEGRYYPGQRLIESRLTATYGISRGPVREALNRLAAIGIVTLTLQRGAHVRRMTVSEAIDILFVVQGLIGIAARQAAKRISRPGAAERLDAALARVLRFDPASGDAEYALARDGFYSALTEIAGNAELRRVVPSVQIHLIRVQFRDAMRSTDRSRAQDYRKIAAAILSGRPAAAEAAVRSHLKRVIDALEALHSSYLG